MLVLFAFGAVMLAVVGALAAYTIIHKEKKRRSRKSKGKAEETEELLA